MKTRPFLLRSRLGFRAVVAALLAVVSFSTAREWTSKDGKKLEADFVSKTDKDVTVRRASDGRIVTLPLDRLSDADVAWVAQQSAPPAPDPTKQTGKPEPLTGPHATLVTGQWEKGVFKNLPFSLYGSKDLSGKGQYPLVVLLHGKSDNNENGKQVGDWMKTFAKEENYRKHPCLLLAPLCYQPHGATGGGWSAKPGDEVIALVKDMVKTLPVDKNRIYVTGHSMGGFGTCHLLAKEPRLFAAGVPMAGCSGDASALRRIPLWVFHAADDDVVKVDGARSLADALERSKTFKYTEFPDGGHGIPGKVWADEAVMTWLFAQGVK